MLTPGTAIDHKPYHLSADELDFFDANGYLILRDRINPELLARLQAAGDQWILAGADADDDAEEHQDWRFVDRPTGRVMFRVDYLHNKGQAASLELLGSPDLLGIAESLAGPDFVPTYESMVFKNAGDGAPIAWHQDAVHPRNYRIANLDIYLDASRTGAGALRVIPGSQRQPADICAITDRHGWEPPGVISVEMNPGDVLVHDVMLVHGSEPTLGNARRRTIYYEFRAAEQILAEGPWDLDWIQRRMRLIPVGLAAYARAFPDRAAFEWNAAPEFRPEESNEETNLRIAHLTHSPGSFCSAGDVPNLAAGSVDAQ